MSDWKPSCTQPVLSARAQMNQSIRAFFAEYDVLEVETPALSQAANTDPHIESFQCKGSHRYLHTSPEYPMKRLLAAGSGDIYQIAKVWRAQELGAKHNPEFTLLEWYRLGFTYHELMQEVEMLLCQLIPQLHRTETVRLTYQAAFIEIVNVDPHIASDKDLQQCIQAHDINISADLDRSALLDVLMTHCVEPQFRLDALTFIYDYPAEQSALACIREDQPPVAERFEVYLGSLELGNGYQELQDAQCNSAVLQRECEYRKRYDYASVPQDQRFLAAMQQGLPYCAGVAVGLDRVLMAKLNKKSIQEVISFAWTVA
jgi:lysyl-tRNA synthetase class 2